MARTVRDSKLETRAARDRLKPRRKEYWKTLEPGRTHLGYRRRHRDVPGVWLVRSYLGLDAEGVGRYQTETLPGLADDFREADGEAILSFAQAQKRALEPAATPKGRRRGPTVADAIADYVVFLKSQRKTGDDAEQRAGKLILPELGATAIADLTAARLRAWRDSMAATGARLRTARGLEQRYRPAPQTAEERRARHATVNRTLTILKAALNRATRDDPAPGVWSKVEPFEETHAARADHLTVAEAQRLMNAADPAFRPLVHAALQTGCRYGELAALRVRDFANGKIAIRTSKSGKPRHVRLTEEGAEFFRQLVAGRDPEALMLPAPDGGPWRKSAQARPMRAACDGAKLKPVGFHQLRHTWASLAVMNGVPLIVVASNLGHTDTRMVERHYGHLTETYEDEAIRAGAPQFGAVPASNVAALRG